MATKPLILLVNDDGVHAPALAMMQKDFSDFADVYIVAPDRDKSGSSQSLTLTTPLHVTWISEKVASVQGTPADCAHLACTGLLPRNPDLVVSGINMGPNLGDDVLYSGTIAAALEARTCGIAALAFSIATKEYDNLAGAVTIVRDMVQKFFKNKVISDTVLNVNIPNLPVQNIQGSLVTRLGTRHSSEAMMPYVSPRGHVCYWIGKPGAAKDCQQGTDFAAIDTGYISITPLQIDMTNYTIMTKVADWIDGS